MTTINPCPFCGEKLVEKSDHHGKWWGHRNDLGECECAINQLHDQSDIDRWNRRASPWRPIGEVTETDLPFYGCNTSTINGMFGRKFPVVAVCRKPQHDGPGRRAWADEHGYVYFFTHFAELTAPPAEGEKEEGK